jgi:mitochondrial distribution and morphology protein 10
MMGHLSTAYAARVSQDLALCSRFDFNMYSYESEWTMGAEWWIRRGLRKILDEDGRSSLPQPSTPTVIAPRSEEVQGVVKARISTSSVRNSG